MNNTNLCKEYCIGCGLCKSELGVNFYQDDKGFLKPNFDKEIEPYFLENVCPVMDKKTHQNTYSLWGDFLGAFEAYSSDSDIRMKASSGGVLTALAIYLLESGEVDGIIQVCAREDDPTETICVVSETKEQVIACCGSRYSISSPWYNLSNLIQQDKQYAAIGKPCDISALKRLQTKYKRYTNINYFLSFFCAGMPSKTANNKLLFQMGCTREKCKSLVYRGNGWPGIATAVDINDKAYMMDYSKAWGEILGRDVNPFCRLCLDGIGEDADIACGDGWYIKDGKPDFSERDGRNLTFVRNKKGVKLFQNAINSGYLVAKKWEDLTQLQIIQKYQYTRKATMKARLSAYHLLNRKTPVYDKRTLREYAKAVAIKDKMRIYFGTVKRILCKKI